MKKLILLCVVLLLSGCGNENTPLRGYPDNYLQGSETTTP